MSIYGLYDLDLWHCPKHYPNLELMKIYNYHYSKGDKVLMVRPGDDTGRFNKVIYFKENSVFLIPKSVNVYGKNKEIYGYGFTKMYFPLDEKYHNVPPLYNLYDLFSEKFNRSNYTLMRNNSFIRFENKDFSDFKKDCKHIFIADHNFCYLPEADLFRKEYKDYKFNYLRRLEIRDKETFYKFRGFNDNRKYFINFRFDEDFLLENYNKYITLNWSVKYENETEEHQLMRLAALVLFYKSQNQYPDIKQIDLNKDTFIKDILFWGYNFNQLSFKDFYEGNKKVIGRLNTTSSDVRLLLKTNPKEFKSSDIDFSKIL